jgi:energy-coupling factor transporter ATP-binding protein EcfA2
MQTSDANEVFSTIFVTRQYKRALADLDRFYDIAIRGREGRCASLFGPAGSGKSTLVEALLQRHVSTPTDGNTIREIVTVEVPSKPSIRSFFIAVLEALGAPYLPREPNGALRNRVLHFFESLNVRLLVLDEFQHLASKVGTDKIGVCDTIKSLMNAGRIGILFVGVDEAETVIQDDAQILTRRVMTISIREFCDTQNPEFLDPGGESAMAHEFQEFKAILHEFSVGFGCPDTSYMCEDAVAMRVLGYTNGGFRVTRDFIEAATFDALQRKKKGVDEEAIKEALRLRALAKKKTIDEKNKSTPSDKKSKKMSKREKELRNANGEFTSRRPITVDAGADSNINPESEEPEE